MPSLFNFLLWTGSTPSLSTAAYQVFSLLPPIINRRKIHYLTTVLVSLVNCQEFAIIICTLSLPSLSTQPIHWPWSSAYLMPSIIYTEDFQSIAINVIYQLICLPCRSSLCLPIPSEILIPSSQTILTNPSVDFKKTNDSLQLSNSTRFCLHSPISKCPFSVSQHQLL